MNTGIGCRDCGTEDMPVDTVLTIKQWELICPEGGVLCATCITRRAAKLDGIINVCARLIFVDDYDCSGPGGKFFQSMKKLDQEGH